MKARRFFRAVRWDYQLRRAHFPSFRSKLVEQREG